MKHAILLFVRHPTPGRVKTRLSARLGAERAAAIYRQLAEKVCELLPREGQIFVAYDPPEKRPDIEKWLSPRLGDPAGKTTSTAPDSPRFFAQNGDDLGAKITRAFDEVFALGFEKIAIIGSDCIEIDAKIFDTTWCALDGHDCVIGPAGDGGYYLVALRKPSPGLFEKIKWSTDSSLLDTLQRARELGLNVFLLPQKNDVDTERDWERARVRMGL